MELPTEDLQEIAAALGAKSSLVLQKRLTGKSGAGVWLVDAQLAAWSGSGVLKVESTSARGSRASEASIHLAAFAHNPAYSKAHIASLVNSCKSTKYQVSLFSAVGGGIENCRALKALPSGLHKSACERVSEDLLVVWNREAIESEELRSESWILQAWLGYRLHVTDGGRIPTRLAEYGVSPTDAAFTYQGVVYPNPLYWSIDDRLNANGGLRPVLGYCHCDFHGDNILVTDAMGRSIEYFLIDFALAEANLPLFYDQAYLQLSSLLVTSETLSIQFWQEEISKIANVHGPKDLFQFEVDKYRIPIADSIAAIKHVCESWSRSKFEARRAQLRRQEFLAHVAVGLNFFNKIGIDGQDRLKALLYAAVHLRAYFSYTGLRIPETAPALREPEVRSNLPIEEVRSASHFVDSFERGRHSYVLVSANEPSDLASLHPEIVARVHWSIVVDLSSDSDDGSLYKSLGSSIAKSSVLRVNLLDRVSDFPPTARSTVWLKARGWDKVAGSVAASLDGWRRKKLNVIRQSMSAVFEVLNPASIRVVVLQGKDHEEYSAAVCEAIYETSAVDDIRCLWLGHRNEGYQNFKDTSLHLVNQPIERLQAGIELSLGSPRAGDQLTIPCRPKGGGSEVELKDFVKAPEIAILKEEFDLVYSELADIDTEPLEADFLKGAPISWVELELEQDVPRDIYDDTLRNLKAALSDPRNKLFEVIHKPGAGGSTLARRLLWNLRRSYPTAVLRGVGPLTAARVETLFHLTSLPVLILAEADLCPNREDVVRLLHAASSRNVRCCVLYVSRLTGPTPPSVTSASRSFVSDVMLPGEAVRFLGRYSIGAAPLQLTRLRQLVTAGDLQRFRSPFFFGLYRFEADFLHLTDYVKAHLQGLNSDQRRWLAYVSLVSVFTQSGFPERMLAVLGGQKYFRGVMVGRIFGPDADRLFVTFSSGGEYLVKASHPLLGQHSLEVSLESSSKSDFERWRAQISVLAQRLIRDFEAHADLHGQDVRDLLMQLFIRREHLSADSQKRNLFAPLMIEIHDEAYQAQIYQLLTTVLPQEPHFWNHFGRHCMYADSKRLGDAIDHLTHAISLAPDDELHQHTLGMIYAKCVREKLEDFERGSGLHVAAWSAIEVEYGLARQHFAIARRLSNASTEHPFVSDIQLITRTISRLRSISSAPTFFEFLTEESSISAFLRGELASGNDLLAEVRRLSDERAEPAEYVEAVDFYLNRIEKSSDALVAYLHRKLADVAGDTVQNRRFLLSLVHHDQSRGGRNIESTKADAYLAIARKNLDAAEPTDQDFRHWFLVYRESKSFNMTEAVDGITRWFKLIGSIDSAFYLYVLIFVQWYDGAITNLDVVLESLQRCTSLSQERNRRQSLEYLAQSSSGVGIVAGDQMGSRSPATGFFEKVDGLASVEGIVKSISGPQAGQIVVVPPWAKSQSAGRSGARSLEAFFVPGDDFHVGADENKAVRFHLGFRRGGLRAFMVIRS